MLEFSRQNALPEGLTAWLNRTYKLSPETMNVLAHTYSTLHELDRSGRDHIWGFVMRNLVRPIWLSQQSQRADVVIGNPPWLAYRFMDQDMQSKFRGECQERGLWTGQVAQQQDLSAYFFVRSIELYLKPSGKIAFVMPYATMTRRQYAGFRTGIYRVKKRKTSQVFASIRVTQAWAFPDDVKPLFPVPSCVLFAENTADAGKAGRLPGTILAASGELLRRNASGAESDEHLTWQEAHWPTEREGRVTGGYADRFRQGAIIIPRLLFTVQEVQAGRLGGNPVAPLVESRRTSQEKLPWKGLPALRENVEKEFLRPLYLGESIAPFRVLSPILAVIPWDRQNDSLLNSTEAQGRGYAYLASWLQKDERLWLQHGSGKRTLTEQLNYYGQLTAQFPIAKLRVIYSKAGTLPAATLMKDQAGLVDHTLYWATVNGLEEGYYLLAVLNSETARKLAERLQARGQWGARHFDKVILSLPIPSFDASNKLHLALSKAAAHAEEVASGVQLAEGMHFVKARQKIRAALREDGVAEKIDKLVAELLKVYTPTQ
jgi:hypothetical protein